MSNPSIPVPPGKTYRTFQENCIRYLVGGYNSHSRGTLLADEMGLGKTVEAIGFLNAVDFDTATIVTPKTLVHNWFKEIDEWFIPIKDKSIRVATYHQAEGLTQEKRDILIIDEAHYIKNTNSQRTAMARALAANTRKHILLLTGSPFDVPIDLWPLLQICCPEKWDPPNPMHTLVISPEQKKTHPGEGPNFWEFAKRYCDLKKVTYPSSRKYPQRTKSAWVFSGSSNQVELNARLRNTCMVRRLKKDVLKDLPEKQRQIIELFPEKIIPVTWNLNTFRDSLSDENYEQRVKALRADKVLFEEWSRTRHEQALAKLGLAGEFIRNALDQSEKIIVFAHHRDVIEQLSKDFLAQDIQHSILTGRSTNDERKQAVDDFQKEPNCRIFLGSISAAGVGLTLTAASHEIFVELTPAMRDMIQAEDRAHRIGQKNMVLIQQLVVNGSLCAKMAKIFIKKMSVANAVLDGEGL